MTKPLEKLEHVEKQSKRAKELQQMQERMLHYQSRAQQAEEQVRKLLKDRGKFAEMIADVKKSVIAVEPYPRERFKAPAPSSSPISPVALVSDWQTGEVILAKETEGISEYNWEIEQRRVFSYAEKVIDWANMHRRAGFPIRDFHIFSLSDHVSGNIHYELEVTNEFPAPVATAKAGYLLAEFIARIAAHFELVHVHEMSADNHGRLTRKNQFKQGAKNNWSYLVHEIANTALGRHKNVVIHQGEGLTMLAEVQGKQFLLKHGHTIKSQLGIPLYGIERDKGREAMMRMGTELEFDYIAMGHWHVPTWWQDKIIINGNLPGTTELDHALGRYAPPSQVSFMVHPKHGVFDFTSWKFR